MKTVSIKIFTIITLSILLSLGGLIFYSFYKDASQNIQQLLTENIQTNILSLKHYLEKNLEKDSVNNVAAHLDNSVTNSTMISDIHLTDAKKDLIYSTDREEEKYSKDLFCPPISEISQARISLEKCYTFPIQKFQNLTPYYLRAYIFIDTPYINSLLSQQLKKYALLFILFFTFFGILFWSVLRHFIVQPLEGLRQYAYYNKDVPYQFKITEIESIRYSLHMTFKRINVEQKKLFKLSTLDPLSGLYNRLSLMEKINWLLSKSKRTHSKFALIFFDLDNFKMINDSQGHEFGDAVLKQVSKVLLEAVRENDIVSRFGGDEFVIILSDIEDETVVVEVIDRLQENLSIPFAHNSTPYSVTASMGIAIYPKDGETPSLLLKNADIAMFEAKDLGKNSYHFFTQELNDLIQEKVYIQKLMREALQNNYFKLFYQPKVDIKTGKIVSCEALIRLIDPNKGIVAPDQFIPIAENNNFIIPLGKWILEEATRQIKIWEMGDLKDIKVSVNVSSVQFHDANLIKIIQNVTKDIDTKSIDIELTESALVTKFDETLKTIQEIKKLGISLSLDDFGTGFSSLSYLKNIPFDTIKIDKSFIDDLESKKGKSFVNMIIAIASNLELEVVAEGVETEEQHEYLKKTGCDIYQGYYCSKPLPSEEFELLVRTKLSQSH